MPQSNPRYSRRNITPSRSQATFSPIFSRESNWFWPTQQYRTIPLTSKDQNAAWAHVKTFISQQSLRILPGTTGSHSFPLSNFKYYLTLFSKFFSSFPHGTCSLSVSRQYLALDEIYHPFRAEIPINSTLWKCIVRGEAPGHKTGFSPSMIPCSKRFIPGSDADNNSVDYNSETRVGHRFTNWAIRASLAVTDRILVSFFSSAYWYA